MTKIKVNDQTEPKPRFDQLMNKNSLRITTYYPSDLLHYIQELNKFEREIEPPVKETKELKEGNEDTKEIEKGKEEPKEVKEKEVKVSTKTPGYLKFEDALKFYNRDADGSNINPLRSYVDYNNV